MNRGMGRGRVRVRVVDVNVGFEPCTVECERDMETTRLTSRGRFTDPCSLGLGLGFDLELKPGLELELRLGFGSGLVALHADHRLAVMLTTGQDCMIVWTRLTGRFLCWFPQARLDAHLHRPSHTTCLQPLQCIRVRNATLTLSATPTLALQWIKVDHKKVQLAFCD